MNLSFAARRNLVSHFPLEWYFATPKAVEQTQKQAQNHQGFSEGQKLLLFVQAFKER